MSPSLRTVPAILVVTLGWLPCACSETEAKPARQDAAIEDAGARGDANSTDATSVDAWPHVDAAPLDASDLDGGAPADSGSPRDASGPDAGPGRDARPGLDAAVTDGSLAGTGLEHVAIQFAETLELCDAWMEGGTLAEGRSRQVRVVLPPHRRGGLEPQELAAARIEAGLVQTDPYAAGTTLLEDQPTSSTLVDWSLSATAGAATLRATIAHDLGAAGVIYEALAVTRVSGDSHAVDYARALLTEVVFSLERPGGTSQLLVPCGGEAQLEEAIGIATFTLGASVLTVLRAERTRLAAAGSAPVYPIKTEVSLRRGSNHLDQDAASFFAQTYTAQHHNWEEHSRIDFTRDRRWSYLVFEPLARGEPAEWPGQVFSSIELLGPGAAGIRDARAEVVLFEPQTGAVTRETYTSAAGWRRVDDLALTRVLSGDCATPRIVTYWDYQSAGLEQFILAGCPGAGPMGFDVRLFVPVLVAVAPSLAGQRFGSSAIRPLNNGLGILVDLGTHKVELIHGSIGITVRLLDDQGTILSTTPAYEATLFKGRQPDERLRYADPSGTVTAVIDRAWLMQGSGSSSVYGPLSFTLTFGGQTHQVWAWDRMRYTNSHHNWDDILEAETDDLRLLWRVLSFGGDVSVRAVRKGDGQELLPATTLHTLP